MRLVSLTLAFSLVSLLSWAAIEAQSQVIVTPNSAAAAEGNSNNGAPLDLSPIGLTSERYQQVYTASLFSALSGPAQITAITFRPDASFGAAFNSVLPDIQINLSTTKAGEDALSTTFANNVGANDTVVFGRGALSLSSADTGPAGGPKTFDIVIPLTTPFLYNPASGNLLMDIRNFGGGTTTTFDAVFTPSDGVSRAYTSGANGVGNATADSTDTMGLVTQFTFSPAASPVPEPGSLALLTGLSLSGAAFLRRRVKVQKPA